MHIFLIFTHINYKMATGKKKKLKIFDWEIGSYSGEVRAADIKKASVKVLKSHIYSIPYYTGYVSEMLIREAKPKEKIK